MTAGGGSRALARLAWRDIARHPGRSLLVAAALALPTAMLASATVVLRTSELAASGSFGQGNLFMLVFLPVVAVAALTAAAALGVGARRQLRELGLLAAAGGSGRHLRLLVLLQGLGLGLLGGLVGIVLGLAVTWAAFGWLGGLLSPVQDETGALVVPRFSVVGRDLAWTVAFMVALALLSALRPAVTAGRAPVVAALAGRRPPRPPRPWLVAAGLVVALAGLALQVVAGRLAARGVILPVQLELLALGSVRNLPSPLLVTLAGAALCTPALVSLAARVVPARPAALRLAARDAARNPGRSAPAVTAVAAGLGMLVVLAGLATVTGPESSGWLTPEAGYLELQTAAPAFPPALRVLLAAFTVMAVAVVLAVNALGRAEARDDLAVLDALGAAPRTRRALAAASAWLLTELGALVGVAVGLSPLLAQRASPSPFGLYPTAVHWPTLALVLLAVPAVAAATAALTPGGVSRDGGGAGDRRS